MRMVSIVYHPNTMILSLYAVKIWFEINMRYVQCYLIRNTGSCSLTWVTIFLGIVLKTFEFIFDASFKTNYLSDWAKTVLAIELYYQVSRVIFLAASNNWLLFNGAFIKNSPKKFKCVKKNKWARKKNSVSFNFHSTLTKSRLHCAQICWL